MGKALTLGIWMALVVFLIWVWGVVLTGEAKAQLSTGVRVVRVPANIEPSAEFFGVDYPNATYVIASGGYLNIKSTSGVQIAVWAPGYWSRVEKLFE